MADKQFEFTREELAKLASRAGRAASGPGLNPTWQRAYVQLADAADFLDALAARCSEAERMIEARREDGDGKQD